MNDCNGKYHEHTWFVSVNQALHNCRLISTTNCKYFFYFYFTGRTRSTHTIAAGVSKHVSIARHCCLFCWMLPSSLGNGEHLSFHGAGTQSREVQRRGSHTIPRIVREKRKNQDVRVANAPGFQHKICFIQRRCVDLNKTTASHTKKKQQQKEHAMKVHFC